MMMLRIAIFVLAFAWVCSCARGDELAPPAEFNHEYDGRVVIWPMSHFGAMTQCGDWGIRGTDHCAIARDHICTIIMTSDGYTEKQMLLVYRIELAHCNGWTR